jgi:AcrR family transcriptional regulator
VSVLRADARRNLGLVLDAASEVFAERGPDASIDEIARRAGVGHGTVFRRFPTKDALLAAVLGRRLDELAARAETLVEEGDPETAFAEFVWLAAEACGDDRAFFDGVPRCECFPEVSDAKARIHVCASELIARAQATGALRGDVTAADVEALVGSAMLAASRADSPDAWRRYIAVVLAGLRGGAQHS